MTTFVLGRTSVSKFMHGSYVTGNRLQIFWYLFSNFVNKEMVMLLIWTCYVEVFSYYIWIFSSFKPTAWKLCMRVWFFRKLSMFAIARASKYLFSKDRSFYRCICYWPSYNAGVWWHRQQWRKSKCNNWTLLRSKSRSTTWPFLCSRSSKTNIRISEVDFLWHGQ
jgi:hypothetical protein